MNPIPSQEATAAIEYFIEEVMKGQWSYLEGDAIYGDARKAAEALAALRRPPTPAADQQTEREAFERTIRSLMLSERNPFEREVDSDGDSIYSNEFVRIAWVGWCCRAPLDACFAGGSPARDVEAPAAINQDLIDAKRYRWLRNDSALLDSPHVYGPDDDCILDGIELDDAIDRLAAAPTHPAP